MCGLCGWVDFSNEKINNEISLKMGAKLNMRGPDSNGAYLTPNCSLMHTRLSIIDLTNGNQPMIYNQSNEKYIIVYNGELYNTEELRVELERLGHRFVGHCDTEVLVHSYAEWGGKCLDKLNGIYAFAIWKEKDKELFLARDRIGVKPLYYCLYPNGILFSSEIKAILANPHYNPVIDRTGLREIFLLGPSRINGSGVFKGISEVVPAGYLKYSKEGVSSGTYWCLKAWEHTENEAQTIEHTRYLVSDSIVRQLVSDVPTASMLSGGLDSSIISKITADYYAKLGQENTTYSVDYVDNAENYRSNSYQPTSDNKYIEIMSKYIKSNHYDIVLDNIKLYEALNSAVTAREMAGMADIDSSLLLFTEQIAKRIKVCLSGECADEIFGGYPWYNKKELLMRDSFPWSNSIDIRENLAREGLLGDGLEDYVQGYYFDTVKSADTLLTDCPHDKRIREMFKLNLDWFMQTLLVRSDRMASYNGLEVRVPYCDHRLVEYAYNMPWKYKSLRGQEKGILREAFKDMLPYDIVYRKKSPYPKTFSPVYMQYVRNRVLSILNDKDSVINEICNREYIIDLTAMKTELNEPWYGQLMRLPQVLAYIIQIDEFFKQFNPQLLC